MDGTIIQQGSFTSDGTQKIIVLRSDIDWMRVYNLTAADGATNNDGVEYYWQRGMTDGRGMYWYHPAADQTVAVDQIAAAGGFYYIDSSSSTPVRSANLVTDITNAAPGVITCNAHGLQTGDIFRLVYCVGAQQLCGIDFTATYVGANTFSPTSMPAIVAAAAPGANAYMYKIPYDKLFYPRKRTITAITQAAQAIVTMSVTHDFTVGQKVRLSVPVVTAGVAFGMTELNGVEATIVATGAAGASGSTNTITIDVDTTGYTAFAFPLTADVPFTPAEVIPIGIDTGTALTGAVDILADATRSSGYIGMRLVAGATGPAGNNLDVMYWQAGKSFSNLAE